MVGGFGLPASTTAVVLDVTAVLPSTPSFLTIWPDGAARPVAASLTWAARQVVSNRVVVGVSAGGKIDLRNAGGTTNLVIDLNGYFATTGGGSGFFPINPTRICDTRKIGPGVAANACNNGGAGTLAAGQAVAVHAVGNNVGAVVATVTVAGPSAGRYLTDYPAQTTRPVAPDLFWTAGQTTGNLVSPAVNLVSGQPTMALFNGSLGPTDLVVDQSGYYSTVGP